MQTKAVKGKSNMPCSNFRQSPPGFQFLWGGGGGGRLLPALQRKTSPFCKGGALGGKEVKAVCCNYFPLCRCPVGMALGGGRDAA